MANGQGNGRDPVVSLFNKSQHYYQETWDMSMEPAREAFTSTFRETESLDYDLKTPQVIADKITPIVALRQAQELKENDSSQAASTTVSDLVQGFLYNLKYEEDWQGWRSDDVSLDVSHPLFEVGEVPSVQKPPRLESGAHKKRPIKLFTAMVGNAGDKAGRRIGAAMGLAAIAVVVLLLAVVSIFNREAFTLAYWKSTPPAKTATSPAQATPSDNIATKKDVQNAHNASAAEVKAAMSKTLQMHADTHKRIDGLDGRVEGIEKRVTEVEKRPLAARPRTVTRAAVPATAKPVAACAKMPSCPPGKVAWKDISRGPAKVTCDCF